jgi:hypothetical protein
MTTDWSLLEVARSYEDYEPVRERAFAYPVMFAELGLTDPAHQTHWPKQVQVGFLETAGFRNVRVEEPTLPAEYDGPGADRMVVERTHPPYTIYLAEK